MGERSTNQSKAAPLYVFVLVDPTTTLPLPELFWSRAAARDRAKVMLATYRVRRAKLTVFNK